MLPPWLIMLWIVKLTAIGMLARKWFISRRQQPKVLPLSPGTSTPRVCIQLPVFNEPENIGPLLDCIARMDWPDSCLEIQVLDDSDDTTSQRAEARIRDLHHQRPGLRIVHLQRTERRGYKAGALNHGLQHSDAPYFAIFDCDFRPAPDFLRRIIPEIHSRPKAAAVQAVWTYSNAGTSMLTSLQKTLLDYHFRGEQAGRFARQLPFNFNGTAGVWRRTALVEAGGWQASTVTEDLYLSYQVQLGGWRLVFCPRILCLSELPFRVRSFLIQQRRWARGNGQVLRLLAGRILSSSRWTLRQKFDSLFHLSGYGMAGLLATAWLALPALIPLRAAWIESTHFAQPVRLVDMSLWLLVTALFFIVFGRRHIHGRRSLPVRLRRALSLLLLAPGLSVLTLAAWVEGASGSGGARQLVFNRTPKALSGDNPDPADLALTLLTAAFMGWCSALAAVSGLLILALMLAGHCLGALYLALHDHLNPGPDPVPAPSPGIVSTVPQRSFGTGAGFRHQENIK